MSLRRKALVGAGVLLLGVCVLLAAGVRADLPAADLEARYATPPSRFRCCCARATDRPRPSGCAWA